MKRKKYIKIPVNSLLERVNTQNKSVKDILKEIRVKETYAEKFPTDELGNDISDDLTYLDLFNGMLEGKGIYDILTNCLIHLSVKECLRNFLTLWVWIMILCIIFG